MSVSPQEKRMEVSMKKWQQNGGSPSPAVPELSPEARNRHRTPKRVSVVYYLCKNGHLDHPHFIEVPLSSPRGLHLKDFVERLTALRGKGMPALYSWSCKSYRSGYVWHDLCEDDMVCPTNGNEYILKGSELLEGALCPTPDCQRQLPQHPPPLAVTKQDDESSSTSPSSPSTDDGRIPQKPDSSQASAIDASTQTDSALPNVCARGFSTEERDPEDGDRDEALRRDEPMANEPFRVSWLSSSKENPDTSESFDVSDQNHPSIRITVTEPEAAWAEGSKTRIADMLVQLIICGAISIRNDDRRFITAYHQRDSPMDSRKGDDSSRFVHKSGPSRESNSLNDKQSLLLVNGPEQQQAALRSMPPLERSTHSSERSCKSVAGEQPPEPEKERTRLKCIPLTIKCSQIKPAKHPPQEDHDRVRSSDSASDSAGGFRGSPEICKHIVAALPEANPSRRLEDFMEEEKKVVGTEEN
ncbi:unnamed protein product [Victoria cruziana]